MDHDLILAQLGAGLPRKLPGARRVVSGTFFARGTHTCNYLITIQDAAEQQLRVVVRIPVQDTPRRREEMLKEHGVLRHLESAGFAFAPTSLLFDPTLERVSLPYSVQTYLQCDRIIKILEPDVESIADAVARLHQIDVSDLASRRFRTYETHYEYIVAEMRCLADWMQRLANELPAPSFLSDVVPLLAEAWDRIESNIRRSRAALERPEPLFALTHGDLGSHNLGRTPTGVVLFDFQTAAIGDPAFDIAKLFRIDLNAERQRSAFVAAYWFPALAPSLQIFVERVSLYELIAALQSSVWAASVFGSHTLQQRCGIADEQDARPIADVEQTFYRNMALIDHELAKTAAQSLKRWEHTQ